MTDPTLSIVIPAYNEASRIRGALQKITGYLHTQNFSWQVVVVDDGSTDATASVVERFLKSEPGVTLLQVPHGGKGWAVRHGMLQAQGEFRFLCDADLSMPIQQVERFLPPAQNDYDVAIGSREAPGARRIGEPYLRHLSGRLFNLLVRIMAVPGISDSQCGFKSFRAAAAEQLFRSQRIKGFSFDVEVLFLASKAKMHIVEVPIDWYFHRESKVRLYRDVPRMVGDLLAVRWNWWRGCYPPPTPAPERSVFTNSANIGKEPGEENDLP